MFKIGLTGGIGSGKTTIAKIYECLGIPVYYADNRAKWLMNNDINIITHIKSLFGNESYHENGHLNRAFLAEIVFNSPKKLKQLNRLIHPAVQKDTEIWHQQHLHHPYTIKEAALIFESGQEKHLDKVIFVYAPKYVRIERVMRRDKVNRSQVEARMKNQMKDSEKRALSDFVIRNNGKHALIPQVIQLHKKLMQLSASDKSNGNV